jgi:hypothetical protein
MRSVLFALLFVSSAQAAQVLFGLPTLSTVTQRSISVLSPNYARAYLAISNAGPSTAYVQFGSISQFSGTVVNPGSIAYKGFPVISGQTIHWAAPSAPANGAYADSPGTSALTIIEGQ